MDGRACQPKCSKVSAKTAENGRVLHQQVVGQEEAITAVSNAVRRSRAGFPTPIAPAVLPAFRTHGVGKTELQSLMNFLDSKDAMVRIDTS